YPQASRKETLRIPTASMRMLSEILSRLTTGQLHADRGDLAQAVRVLPETEDLLHRGIACGALADPWNILGFQGLFPLFTAREDSIRDHRIDELVHVVEQIFNFSSRLISESAAAGDKQLSDSLLVDQRRLADWWDRFASVEVSDVRRVHGGETVASAAHVAQALARWHERGEKTADLSFWKEHLEGFQSPKAFALVVDALLHKQDYRAAMALLINWLSQAEQVPLEDGEYSFHTLTLRWMLGVTREEDGRDGPSREATLGSRPSAEVWPLVKKFFDYLEANAEEYWQVPTLEFDQPQPGEESEEKEESIYSAAYEEVTYRDSADDNQEGAVADGSTLHEPFDLEQEGDRLGKRLR